MPVRIKFCGMTRVDDVRAAIDLGVNAIGLVFAAGSPRLLNLNKAESIANLHAPMMIRVALFRNSPANYVREVLATMPIEVLQFHGDEDAEYCEQFQRPYWKAIGMANGSAALNQQINSHPRASSFVLDSHLQGAAGGSGQVFDWSNWPRDKRHSLVLAGGLHADNIASAIVATQCMAVDVSSGIETSPGLKDQNKMQAFVRAARGALG